MQYELDITNIFERTYSPVYKYQSIREWSLLILVTHGHEQAGGHLSLGVGGGGGGKGYD